MTKKVVQLMLWSVPWLLQSNVAHAWGLYTHLYFAQWLLWGVPLADAELRRAIARYPKLVLAGACMPDFALVGPLVGTSVFESTHCWHNAAALLADAKTDQERALVVGFYSHLFTDVVAHHHFVPTHERLWVDWPMLAHTMSEWAMDAHVTPHLMATPQQLLLEGEPEISVLLSRHYHISLIQARQVVLALAHADYLLRFAKIPSILYGSLRRMDRRLSVRFDHFTQQAVARLPEINRVLSGEVPHPNPNGESKRRAQRRLSVNTQQEMQVGVALPKECYFQVVTHLEQ